MCDVVSNGQLRKGLPCLWVKPCDNPVNRVIFFLAHYESV